MIRQKIELVPSLKAEDFDTNSVVISTGYIEAIKEVKTRFNEEGTTSTVITVRDDAEKDAKKAVKGVFANMTSINNCIKAFGEDDTLWTGKGVKVICNKENYLNKKQLVIEALN